MNIPVTRTTALLAAVAAVVLAVAVTPAVASAQTVEGVSPDTVTRLWGQDRYATSLAVAKEVAEDAGGKLSTAVVVSGRSWTDAVTAAPLAGSVDAPVLLTDRGGVSDDILEFLETTGVTRIVAIGSTANISDAALDGLGSIDPDIERVAARDASSTSVAVAKKLGAVGTMPGGFGRVVILASSAKFADALVAGAFGAYGSHPILLTAPNDLDDGVAGFIAENADHVIIMGGPAAIAGSVEQELLDAGKATLRLGGTTRIETATAAAEFIDGLYGDSPRCFDRKTAGLVTAWVPFDALSAAPLLARKCAPMVLTASSEMLPAAEEFLGRTEHLYVFGGTAAIAEDVVNGWTLRPAAFEFRHWDHQALIDLPLWAHCPPEVWPSSLTDLLDGYDITWAGWDTKAAEVDGRMIATGWMTDTQIGRWLPGSGITAEGAQANLAYVEQLDSVTFWDGRVTPHRQGTPDGLPDLGNALRFRNLPRSTFDAQLAATRFGVDGSGAWPSDVRVGYLLTDWLRFRYAQPPTTMEPVAWPLRSLFEARESACAGEALIAMCASDETPPVVLRSQHPIGRVLRSLACAE